MTKALEVGEKDIKTIDPLSTQKMLGELKGRSPAGVELDYSKLVLEVAKGSNGIMDLLFHYEPEAPSTIIDAGRNADLEKNIDRNSKRWNEPGIQERYIIISNDNSGKAWLNGVMVQYLDDPNNPESINFLSTYDYSLICRGNWMDFYNFFSKQDQFKNLAHEVVKIDGKKKIIGVGILSSKIGDSIKYNF